MAAWSVSFFVQGVPKSMSVGATVRWRTKDGTRSGSFQKREHTEWSTLVGEIGRKYAPPEPLTGAVELFVTFLMPRPASGKKAAHPLKRPDLDNLLHKLTDQWNMVFWRDDSQIVRLSAGKVFADGRSGAQFTIQQQED